MCGSPDRMVPEEDGRTILERTQHTPPLPQNGPDILHPCLTEAQTLVESIVSGCGAGTAGVTHTKIPRKWTPTGPGTRAKHPDTKPMGVTSLSESPLHCGPTASLCLLFRSSVL
jgi:hypothetical protein